MSKGQYMVDESAASIKYNMPEPVSVGSGEEISIRDLASLIAGYVGYEGRIEWDNTKPDGQPRRKLDVSRAKKEFGFVAKIPLKEGLKRTIEWYLARA